MRNLFRYPMFRFLLIISLLHLSALPFFAQPAVAREPALMSDSEINSNVVRLGRLYNMDSSALAKLDKIITYDRDVYVGKIHNITFAEVRFISPGNDRLVSVNKSEISQILYADGRRDVFIALEDKSVKQQELVDTARIIIKNQKDWMKVTVTENPDDVKAFTARGNLKVTYEAETGNVDNDELMRQVSVRLKKKAAALRAHCVLVESKFFKKGYGELPRVEVIARAYGY
jgi:hypothetical protein